MACFHPLDAYRMRGGGVTFNRNSSFLSVPVKLPCGRCAGCLLERSRQWAMRCLHEAKMHPFNTFATLTYDNEHLPHGGTLVKRDLQLFIKRLRKSRCKGGSVEGRRIRFYACGEYGERNERPHYHLILFNCFFPDRRLYKKNVRGEGLYTSKELTELWGKSDLLTNLVGEVTFDSAAYVARYVLKKMGRRDKAWYDVELPYGEIVSRLPEFTCMSLKPGIGQTWFDKFGAETYLHDSVIINGQEVRPPRFYDKKLEVANPSRLVYLKMLRRKKAKLYAADNTEDRLRVKEVITLRKLEVKRRSV